jgi:hypothetical protein
MITAVLRTAPWPAVTGASAVAAVLGGAGVAVPAAGPTLIALAFALLAAAAAFALDEPASLVVDVTPARLETRIAIRGLVLAVPLAVGALLAGAGALRALALPWPAVWLALAGSVLLGFTAACLIRWRTGEPGARAAPVVVALLVVPGIPPLSRWVPPFPASAARAPASQLLWACVLAACAVAIAATCSGRLHRAA